MTSPILVLAILVTAIMSFVALLHFYWAFGGSYGLTSAGPSLKGSKNFIPGRKLIFLVSCVFAGLAVLPLQLIRPWALLEQSVSYIGFFVSIVFIIRGIGDFKYVGICKKIYNSHFAKLDTAYFSPLILFLGLAYALLAKYGG